MTSPALYVSAELDTLTPLNEQLGLYARSPEPKRYEMIPGANHHNIYREPRLIRLLEMSVDWFNEHLRVYVAE